MPLSNCFRLSADCIVCVLRMASFFLLISGSTGFTLNLGATAAPTTTASTGLTLGGALAGLGGTLFQNAGTATGEN